MYTESVNLKCTLKKPLMGCVYLLLYISILGNVITI